MSDDIRADTSPTITSEDVLPIAATHLDHARRRARRLLRTAQQQATAAARDQERAARADARADAAVHESIATQDTCTTALAAATDDLDVARSQLDTAEAGCRDAHERSTIAAASSERLEELCERFTALLAADLPSTADEAARWSARLTELSDQVDAFGATLDRSVLTTWRDQLDAGTAPMHPDAARLLAELEQAEADWLSCGAGELADDPAVIAADAEVRACQDAVAMVDAGGIAGSAGHQARVAIELAAQNRARIEALGKRADPVELAAADEAQRAALAQVGFDSMLDFRLAMSGTGVGALTAQRRRVVADELAAARAELDRTRDAQVHRHAELRAARDELRRRAVERFDLNGSLPLPDQLRGVLAFPGPVQALAEQVGRLARAARTDAAAATEVVDQSEGVLGEAGDAVARLAGEVDRRAQDLARSEQQLGAARDAASEATARRCTADDALTEAEAAEAVAAEECRSLEDCSHLPEDVDELMTSILRMVDERADGGGSAVVRLQDPLADEPVELTIRMLDELDAGGHEVELVTARRAVLAATRRRRGSVRVVDGRRRRFGQRRNREPSASTR
jgi:hypothetical protein